MPALALLDMPDPPVEAAHHFRHPYAPCSTASSGCCCRCSRRDGFIWVSWPKQASKVPTDITEDVIRAVALPLGLVDVKVCAVDATWSGLKLVIRKELR